MTNRRANHPPVPKNRHEVRKTKPFALHRTRMSRAVEGAFNPDNYSSFHPAQPPAPWPWSWYEATLRWLRRAKRLFL